jgi:hypothetical protein
MQPLLMIAALGVLSASASAGQPWEISTKGGYLNGARVVLGRAEEFDKQPKRGEQTFLSYDEEGKSPIVGWGGKASRWEFVPNGPEEFYIRAAEGKWKGWYLTTSDRAFKHGGAYGFLLEMGKEPQVFHVYRVGK